jgi:hypothetical protein
VECTGRCGRANVGIFLEGKWVLLAAVQEDRYRCFDVNHAGPVRGARGIKAAAWGAVLNTELGPFLQRTAIE